MKLKGMNPIIYFRQMEKLCSYSRPSQKMRAAAVSGVSRNTFGNGGIQKAGPVKIKWQDKKKK